MLGHPHLRISASVQGVGLRRMSADRILSQAQRQDTRPSYELICQSYHSIDVLIKCYVKAVNIVLDTARAATTSQGYPAKKLRILVA